MNIENRYEAICANQRQEISRLRSSLEQEHENFLSAHRDNMRAAGRIAELNALLSEAEGALKGIAEKSWSSEAMSKVHQALLSISKMKEGR